MRKDSAVSRYVRDMRRALHRIPELSGVEFKTSDFLYENLVSLGYAPVRIHTGMYADCPSANGELSPAIALRCDMDALPITEKNDVPFRAEKNMHACGHDGHMAIVLGVAKVLKESPPENAVRLIFQYGEEGEGGADKMIESGVLNGVNEIYAFHLCPELEKGRISSTVGAMFAGAAEFDIEIVGKASHCASRKEGKDAVSALGCFFEHKADIERKYAGTLLHVGKVTAGSARNIVADRADLKCTFRFFDEGDCDGAIEDIKVILAAADKQEGTTSSLKIMTVYPPLVNSRKAYEKLCSAAKIEECNARHTAEDFAFYTKKIDGCMAWLGIRDENHFSPLHSDTFGFDEDALMLGVETMLSIVNKARTE